MNKKTVKDFDVKGKRVLCRVDFNVPQDESGKITDDNRIVEALTTIKYLLAQGARVILCSHLGKPEGVDKKYSLAPVKERLSKLLKQEVIFAEDVVGKDAEEKSKNLKDGEVLLLENVRFCPEEEKNDKEFSKKLASFADLYIDDAFGTAHRKHASTYGVAEFLPSGSGFLMAKEIEMLSSVIDKPERPFLAILGGAKVADKISVIKNLLEKVDMLIIGGAMAYTFIKAQGGSVGKSLVDDTKLDFAREIEVRAREKGVELYLPIDNVVAQEINKDAKSKIVSASEIPEGFMGLDIGPKTIKLFKKAIKSAKTVLWNGPMGVFEIKKFAKGTREIIKAVAKCKGDTIVGGGDSTAAVIKMGYKNKFTHVSTGGGASLKLLEGASLPGIDCLQDK